jgi:hypothetical protein
MPKVVLRALLLETVRMTSLQQGSMELLAIHYIASISCASS